MHSTLPGNVTCAFAAQKEHRFRHILGGAEPAEGNAVQDLLAGVLRQLLHHPGGNEARSQSVDRHVSGGHFTGHRLGKTDEAGFGSGIVGLARVTAYPHHRRDVNDAALVLPYQVRHDVLGTQEGPPQIHIQHLVPVLSGHAQQQPIPGNPSIVCQDINGAQPFRNLFDYRLGRLLLGNVALHRYGFASPGRDGFDHLGGGIPAIAVVHPHPGPGLGQPAGDDRADAPGRPGDQRHPPEQANSLHLSSPSRPLACCAGGSQIAPPAYCPPARAGRTGRRYRWPRPHHRPWRTHVPGLPPR